MAQEVDNQMDGRSGRLNELALFAGAGGGILGSVLSGHRIVAAVEIAPYAREIILRRQEDGSLPPFPVWSDCDTFDGKPWRGKVDIVSGGFPCQGWSLAGKRRQEKDSRNKWPATLRIIDEVRPRHVLLENVLGIRPYIGRVTEDLSALGYLSSWGVLPAREAGAPHERKRWWCIARSESE